MRSLIDLQRQLVPDLLETVRLRYGILHQVLVADMIGRRSLASALGMTERVLRAETDFLKEQGFLEINASGMRVSQSGRRLLEEMEPVLSGLLGLSNLEEQLRTRFGLSKVVIVPGDSDHSASTKRELGRAGASALLGQLREGDVVAVTGGSTLAQVASHLNAPVPHPSNLFVPARGGLGESLEYQASTIVSAMAKRTGAQYRMLHVPDHLSEEAYTSLMHEPGVKEVVGVIRGARIVIHGIGDAMTMARRRRVESDVVEELRQEGARRGVGLLLRPGRIRRAQDADRRHPARGHHDDRGCHRRRRRQVQGRSDRGGAALRPRGCARDRRGGRAGDRRDGRLDRRSASQPRP